MKKMITMKVVLVSKMKILLRFKNLKTKWKKKMLKMKVLIVMLMKVSKYKKNIKNQTIIWNLKLLEEEKDRSKRNLTQISNTILVDNN